MASTAKSQVVWPRGWSTPLKRKWLELGLDVGGARRFSNWGWTPTAALNGAAQVGDDALALLGEQGLVIPPGRDIGHVLALHHYGVTSTSPSWDEAAFECLQSAPAAHEIAVRLSPGDHPVLTVLAALHQVDADLPADVALARHADTGCACEPGRFPTFLGIQALPVANGAGLLTMQTYDAEELQIRTGPLVAVRADGGPWVRLPDLASACWYLSRQDIELVETATGDPLVALGCVKAIAKLAGESGYEVEVNELELQWTGYSLVPRYHNIPDRIIVADDYWDGDDSSPLTSGSHRYQLVLLDGEYFLGGDEMEWEEVGPFASNEQATEWFVANYTLPDVDNED